MLEYSTNLQDSLAYRLGKGDSLSTSDLLQIPDKASDYTSEAITLYPADTPEEGFYFYIPLTKDVVKRATFTKCEVYTESIIRALLH